MNITLVGVVVGVITGGSLSWWAHRNGASDYCTARNWALCYTTWVLVGLFGTFGGVAGYLIP
jgi:hypothetical protein